MLCYDLDAGFATTTWSADIFGADILELVHMPSALGVHVACSSLKLPLIGFATSGTFGLSLVCGLVTLLIVYLSWRFIYKGKPTRGKDIEVSLDDLSAEDVKISV
jgi:hypothetical protein